MISEAISLFSLLRTPRVDKARATATLVDGCLRLRCNDRDGTTIELDEAETNELRELLTR